MTLNHHTGSGYLKDGTFLGHVMPGTSLLIMGLCHYCCLIREYYRCLEVHRLARQVAVLQPDRNTAKKTRQADSRRQLTPHEESVEEMETTESALLLDQRASESGFVFENRLIYGFRLKSRRLFGRSVIPLEPLFKISMSALLFNTEFFGGVILRWNNIAFGHFQHMAVYAAIFISGLLELGIFYHKLKVPK
ncbi:unnamed protein product [Protopolystoma xenopodis]|uniref:Uncharacterized protein n=1 Tax=Protopolystoma xenopodis TaxID=117903 RepID=A0A448WJW9_9PLAT|nr:unnamed protein product [Protopolystoma xenopodis]